MMALPFRTKGKISEGCKYVVVEHVRDRPKVRTVVSCHRKLAPARETLAKVRRLKAGSVWRRLDRLGIVRPRVYTLWNIDTGKKMKKVK